MNHASTIIFMKIPCHKSSAVRFTKAGAAQETNAAFTLADLLALLGLFVLLALFLTPALARTRVSEQGFQCLNNFRQLMTAMLIYTHDYQDWLPPNPDDGNTTPYGNWVGGQAGVGGGNEYDPDILKDPTRSLLAPYQGTNVSIYHCPADIRPPGNPEGVSANDPALKGSKISASRSVSMSSAVGTLGYYSGGGGRAAVYGPWLSGSHNETRSTTWFTFGKTSSMLHPGPVNTLVLIDENKFSINDGCFATVGPKQPATYLMIDWPSIAHGGACTIAFGDGHSEIHRWRDTRTYLNTYATTMSQPDNQDIWWLSVKTTALINGPDFHVP
jgi:prepilin-type processing-associated H-X9-DG protein